MGNQQLRHFRDRYYMRADGTLCSRVKNAPRKDRTRQSRIFQYETLWFKELRASETKKGYLRIKLPIGCFSIHRIVGELYVPNPGNLPQINHLDGVKTNNVPENLQWVTNQENLDHARQNGLRRSIDYALMRHLLETSMLSQREIAEQCACSLCMVEVFVRKSKVQRPEQYWPAAKTVETRAKLVGTKWFRSGERAK